MLIRLAVPSDLTGIMEVEQETFGQVGDDAMASRDAMHARIALLNGSLPGWFWVAEHRGRIVGDIILQPTDLDPDDITSWDMATDGGTLKRTFHANGRNVFAASLAAPEDAPAGTADLLVHQAFVLRLSKGMKFFMLCARMPGYRAAFEKEGMTPEDYWQAVRADGSPRDWMIREYTSMAGGEGPVRLLLNGYPPDIESGGHSVLFANRDAVRTLASLAMRIYRGGIVRGSRKGKTTEDEQ